MSISLGTAALLGGGSILSSALSGLFGASAADKAYEQQEKNKARARSYLSDYGYTSYESPYSSFLDNIINTYGSGNLTASQEQQLQQAGKEGSSNIATTMANRGGTIGGQLAANEKLNTNLANQRLALSDQNVNTAINLANTRDQLNLSDWINQQNASMRQKELLASYA